MEHISLTKEGLLLSPQGEGIADPLPVLSCPLALDDDCSLRSFFSMLLRYPVLQNLSLFLPPAVEQMEKCPEEGCQSDDPRILVLGKTMELIGFPGKPRAELYMWLRGLFPGPEGIPEDDATDSHVDSRLAALMVADRETRFIPLQLLLDTPLVLGGLKHVVLGDVNRHLFCRTRFTLFEVVDGLAWELGFQGGSQQCSIGR